MCLCQCACGGGEGDCGEGDGHIGDGVGVGCGGLHVDWVEVDDATGECAEGLRGVERGLAGAAMWDDGGLRCGCGFVAGLGFGGAGVGGHRGSKDPGLKVVVWRILGEILSTVPMIMIMMSE